MGGLTRYLRNGGFDFPDVLRSQLDLAGAHDAFGLLGVAGSDDCPSDGGKAQGPGDGDGAGRGVVASGDFFQTLDQGKIFGELGLAKFGIVPAPVVFRKIRARSRVMAPVSKPEAIGE